MNNPQVRFEIVPPPAQAPRSDIGETLGLPRGLRPERPRGQFRCASCEQMQRDPEWIVYVPDGVRIGDPGWSVTESARQNAYNGSGSGWCLTCAQALGGKPMAVLKVVASDPERMAGMFLAFFGVGIVLCVIFGAAILLR